MCKAYSAMTGAQEAFNHELLLLKQMALRDEGKLCDCGGGDLLIASQRPLHPPVLGSCHRVVRPLCFLLTPSEMARLLGPSATAPQMSVS